MLRTATTRSDGRRRLRSKPDGKRILGSWKRYWSSVPFFRQMATRAGRRNFSEFTGLCYTHQGVLIAVRKIKEAAVPLGWKKGHHHSMVDRRSRFLESTTLLQKPTCGLTSRWHLHTGDDDLDLGRAAVDEEFDAVDETRIA